MRPEANRKKSTPVPCGYYHTQILTDILLSVDLVYVVVELSRNVNARGKITAKEQESTALGTPHIKKGPIFHFDLPAVGLIALPLINFSIE
jgi:hypothetical protein